jgi:hypothetical protein
MGQRISFYKNNSEYSIKELLIENYSVFKDWYLNVYLSDEEKNNYILYKYLIKNINLKDNFKNLKHKLINEILADFVGCYCNTTEIINKQDRYLELILPFVNKWNYNDSTKEVYKIKDKQFINLWNIIINGRSLKDDKKFESYTNEFKVGYLSRNEYDILKEKIEHNFKNIEINNKETFGISCALQAINEMGNYNKEMVITIE